MCNTQAGLHKKRVNKKRKRKNKRKRRQKKKNRKKLMKPLDLEPRVLCRFCISPGTGKKQRTRLIRWASGWRGECKKKTRMRMLMKGKFGLHSVSAAITMIVFRRAPADLRLEVAGRTVAEADLGPRPSQQPVF